MRPYEVMIILEPALEETAIREQVDRFTEIVRSGGGSPGRVDRWGRRRLAYEIDHQREGYYVLVEAAAEPAAMDALDRALHLADEVLRHKIVRIPDHVAGRPRRSPTALPDPAETDADATQAAAEVRRQFLQEAVRAFTESLEVFTRVGFPFQHALAKHNLGLAYAALGGVTNLRRALAAAEDAVAILDPRLHSDAWRQAYGTLERIEKELGQAVPGMSRTVHFANLAADLRRDERMDLVKERLYRLFALPDRGRAALTELARAIGTLEEGRGRGILEAGLSLVMEMTQDVQEVALLAIWDAHCQLSGPAQETLDRELDQAIGDALGGPQRVYVRDFLYARGWERPG